MQGDIKKGLDSPPGTIDYISSGISGGLIQYFTPYPLRDLLEGCLEFSSGPGFRSEFTSAAGVGIAGCVSMRGGLDPDEKLASLFIDAVRGRLHLKSVSPLVALADSINGRKIGIRSEMVYANAPIASLSSMVYPHHEKLPELMTSCAEALRSGPGLGNYLAACVIGFFCLTAHPFRDGNGRWARIVVAYGNGRGESLDAALCSLFLHDHKNLLAKEIWPHGMRYGLRKYLSAAFEYRDYMLKKCGHLFQASTIACDLVNDVFGDQKIANLIIQKLFSTGELSINSMKTRYRDDVEKLIYSLIDVSGEYRLSECGVSCRGLWKSISEYSLSAKL